MGETSKKDAIKLRPMTFFPPFIILCIIVAVSMVSQEHFLGMIDAINNAIIKNFGWAASMLAPSITGVAAVATFSKFGHG